MREADIQNLIRMELSKYGIVLRPNNGQFQTPDGRTVRSGLPNGTSDLLFIGKGYIAFIEVKQPGKHAQEEQRRFIEAIRKLGHIAGVAHNVQEALEIIREGKEHGNCGGLQTSVGKPDPGRNI